MLKNLTLALALLFAAPVVLRAQLTPTCAPNEPGAATCAAACVRCDFGIVQGTTADNAVSGTFPPFCGTLYKPEWYAFVAGADAGSFVLEAAACDQGLGLQIALYDNCGSTPLACLAGGGLSLTLPVSNLIPGNTYYLLVDGYQGDNCSYTLQPADPPALTTAPAPGVAGVQISGPSALCPGGSVTYCLTQPEPNASAYTWEAPAGASINEQGNQVTLPAPGGQCVNVVVGQSGGQIRVTAKNSCLSSTPLVKNSTVAPIPPTILPAITITPDQVPYTLPWGDVALNSGLYSITLVSNLGCDSVVRQQITITPGNDAAGKVFADLNANGVLDGSDFPMQGVVVSTTSGQMTSTSNSGTYVLNQLLVGDTIRAGINLAGVTVNPDFYLNQSGPENNLNFAVSGTGPADLRVDLTNLSAFRVGFNTGLVLSAWNNSLKNIPGGQLWLVVPGNLDFIQASPGAAGIMGDTLFWNFGALAPGKHSEVVITVRTPVGTPLGDPVDVQAWVDPVNDAIPANNFTALHRIVTGSFDPNDKQVEPAYITPATLSTLPPFEYTIRFQNTGNSPADIVRLTDTLPASLDPASFRFLSSSHPCTWNMPAAGVLEFTFNNIHLPDSSSDESGSHGFAKFSARPKPGLSLGDVVENFADIYFDFNPPVRTNTAGTEVVYFIPGNPPAGAMMKARPNPAVYRIYFTWDAPLAQHGTLRLFTLNGNLAAEASVDAGSKGADLYVADQPTGLYLATVEAGAQRYARQVLIQRGAPVRRN